MPRQLPTFPEQPALIYTITLDGVRYRIRWTWRKRQSAWYVDLYTQDGTAVAKGRRVSGRFSPLSGIRMANQPPGQLLILGDVRERHDLGTEDGRPLYFSESELPAEEDDDIGIRVSV